MSYQVIGAKRRYKYCKLPFLTTNDDPVKKIKFTNYDRYNRREALSSMIGEVIRTNFRLLFFFYEKFLQA